MTKRSLGLTSALLLLPAAVFSQVDTSEWKCELCPFEEGYRSDHTVGAAYASDDAARFGNASGIDEAGAYVLLDGEGHYDRDGYQLDWNALDLGLASRTFELEAGRQGSFGVRLGYSELPYRLFDTTNTIYGGSSIDVLTVPAGWSRAGQTGGFVDLASALVRRDIESDRRTMTIGGHVKPTPEFRVFTDFRRQRREGIDVVSGSVLTQAAFLPRVVDYRTDVFDLGVGYARGPLALALTWYGSFFANEAASLTWDTPFSTVPGAVRGRIALEPDNDFQQLTFSGSYRFVGIPSVIAFSATAGRGEQNQAFVPYTINPNLTTGALPRAALDGRVDTSNYAVTLTSRPFDKVRFRLAYRVDERDNRTSRSPFTRVIVDRFVSGETDLNTPYSFERSRLGLSGTYRILRDLRVSAGYRRSEHDRDFQEVAEQNEDEGWGRLDWRPADWVDVSLKGGTARREIDRYDAGIAASFGQNPQLRKYNLAYRYRQFGELTVAASPPESSLSLGLSARYADDSYTESQFGLTGSDVLHIAFDVGYTLSDTASIYLLGGRESYDAAQTGSQLFADPDWRADHEDNFDHFGGGVTIRQIGERTDFALDYTHTSGETSISVRSPAGGDRFPDLGSDLDSLKLTVGHRLSDRVDIDIFLRYERFETTDWALASGEPDDVPTLLTLGANPYDYNVWVIGLGFQYRVGKHDITFPE